jgi:arabinofuranosyltransferase
MRRMGPLLIAGLVPLIVLCWLAAGYLPFISDDALISLRYAQRFIEGQGLTWTAGPPVEGYSNLLWILLVSLLGALGCDLIVAVRVLGYGCGVAVLLALLHAHRSRGWAECIPALAGGLGLALAGPIVVWTIGGLEQPLQAALLAWAMVLCYPLVEPQGSDRKASWLVPGVVLALLCLTRPDGALFTAAAGAGLLFARGISRQTLRLCMTLLALPAATYVAQLGFRLVYYGEWVPNSALAKLAFTGTRVSEGLAYLSNGLLSLLGLVVPALVLGALALSRGRHSPRVRFLAMPLLIWSAYVVLVGGDSFPAYRFLVPVVVLLALLLATGLTAIERHHSRTAVCVLACLGVLAWMQHVDVQNERARLERWEWDGQGIGTLLKQAFPTETLLAVDPAGTLPYFSELPALDMLGINDRYLAHNPPPDFGHGHLGHELGDGAYVLEREPDLIVFCGPTGRARPCFRSGKELFKEAIFRERYRLVTLEADQPYPVRAQVWVRAEGGRVGITREPARVSVPAYFLMATPYASARLDTAMNNLVVTVTAGRPVGLAGLALGPGRWRLTVEARGSAPRVMLRVAGSPSTLAQGASGIIFRLDPRQGASIDLQIGAGEDGAPIDLFRLDFERLSAE